jgi:hypothetical protein
MEDDINVKHKEEWTTKMVVYFQILESLKERQKTKKRKLYITKCL